MCVSPFFFLLFIFFLLISNEGELYGNKTNGEFHFSAIHIFKFGSSYVVFLGAHGIFQNLCLNLTNRYIEFIRANGIFQIVSLKTVLGLCFC